jgi:hypothetical protein
MGKIRSSSQGFLHYKNSLFTLTPHSASSMLHKTQKNKEFVRVSNLFSMPILELVCAEDDAGTNLEV